MWLLRVLVVALALVGLAIALVPEPPAHPMPGAAVRVLKGRPDVLPLADIREFDASIPGSIRADPTFELLRSWTPQGLQPLELEFGPLPQAAFVGVVYQGGVRDGDFRNALYLRCTTNSRIKPVSTGATNTTITYAIVPLGQSWCDGGEVYLRLIGTTTGRNVGVAEPFESSAVAYLKQSYLGYAGYYLLAFGILLSVFFAGGLAARASRSGLDPVLGGLLALGATCLVTFYLHAWTPLPSPAGLLIPAGLVALAAATRWRRPALAASVWRAQRGVARAWLLVGFATFSVLHLASTGTGAWEPAFRFAPAAWSSDHLLPMLLAEAARIGRLPADGAIGGWSLSDRPPLMAGAYLLFGDLFSVLQAGNDGPHLQPVALGVGGIAACSLWAPSFYWAARRAGKLGPRAAGIGVALVAVTPFALFNTGYTWPKLFAAAFSLAAASYVFRLRAVRPALGETTTFGALSAFALLSHAASAFFLAPVSLIYLASRLWRSPKAAVAGAAVGLAILGSWSVFKADVLPSNDPLMAYALTGELQLGAPPSELPARLKARYEELGLLNWLATKGEIAAYLFTPFPPAGPGTLMRPSPLLDEDLAGRLRQWDFYALTAGNLPLLVLGLAGGWAALRPRSPQSGMAAKLLLACLGCYGLFLALTFLPLFIHQFSYDAILAVAVAGVVVSANAPRERTALVLLLAAGGLYTGAVWLLAPLSRALTLDIAAAVSLAVLLATAWLLFARGRMTIRRSHAILAALAVAGMVGAVLVASPSALIIPLKPSMAKSMGELTATSMPRCLGSLDGIVRRKDGGWRLYGWAWDERYASPAGSVRIVDAGRTVGSATMGAHRPDVQKSIEAVTQPGTGWTLDTADRPSQPIALAKLADGSECRLAWGGR